jgi:hypothetical protein
MWDEKHDRVKKKESEVIRRQTVAHPKKYD